MPNKERPIVTILIFLFLLATGIAVLATSFISQRKNQAPTQTSAAECSMRFVVEPSTTATPFPTATPVATKTPTPTLSPSPTPADNVFFKQPESVDPQSNKFFIFPSTMQEPIHLTPEIIALAKDPTKLIPGHQYKVRIDMRLQNLIKTSALDNRNIRTVLTVNGTQIDQVEWPFSLVSNSSGGGGQSMGGVFTATQTLNTFELRTDTLNTIIESNENDNLLTQEYQSTLPTITLKVKLDSLTGSPNTIQAKVRVGKIGEALDYFSQTLAFQKSGSDFVTILPAETYSDGKLWIAIKAEKHIQKILSNQEFTDTKTIDITTSPFSPGDTPPQDGVVNINDINLILSVIPKPNKTAQEIFAADLNYDTVVNAADISAILKTLSSKSDEIPF